MTSLKKFYFLPGTRFAPVDDADHYLGAIVKDYDDIDNGFVPDHGNFSKYFDDPIVYNDYDVFDVQASAIAKMSHGYGTGLSEAISFKKSRSSSTGITINAKSVRYRRMQNQDDILSSYLSSEAFRVRTRKWFHSGIRQTACMIIGLLICDEVVLNDAEQISHDVDVKGSVPVLSAVAAAGIAFPISVPDPTFNLERGAGFESKFQGTYHGAKIIGLEYRWIRKKLPFKPVVMSTKGPSSKYHLADSENEEEDTSEEEENSGTAQPEAWNMSFEDSDGSWLSAVTQ